jgi:hypothetical protein
MGENRVTEKGKDFSWPLTAAHWTLIGAAALSLDSIRGEYHIAQLIAPGATALGLLLAYVGFAFVVTALIYAVNSSRETIRLRRCFTICGWCFIALSVYDIWRLSNSASQTDEANVPAAVKVPTPPTPEGSWTCIDRASLQRSLLMLNADGTVSISSGGPAIHDPLLRWRPMENEESQSPVPLWYFHADANNLMVQWPSKRIDDCTR